VSVVAPVLPRAARARRHVAPLLPSASGPVQSTHPEVPLLLLPHAARASWHWSLRPTACRPRRAPTPDPRRAIHQSVPSRAFRSGWFPLSLRPLCRSDGVKPAHRRFAYKRVSPFILARPSVRRAAISAADAELLLLSPFGCLTTPTPRLDLVKAQTLACCSVVPRASLDFELQRWRRHCLAVGAHQRHLHPNADHQRPRGELLVLSHYFPGRPHRRLTRIPAGRAVPLPEDHIARSVLFPGA
jgi:hypothetical protein